MGREEISQDQTLNNTNICEENAYKGDRKEVLEGKRKGKKKDPSVVKDKESCNSERKEWVTLSKMKT